jgi:hypothetical protein
VLSKRRKIALVVLAIAAALIALLVTGRWGPGVTPDSVNYIAAARHLARGAGLTSHMGEQLVLYAPLYPAFLSAIARVFRLDPLAGGQFSSAILFGLIIWMSGYLMLRHLRSCAAMALLGAALLPVAGPLVRVSTMVWTEPLFIALVLLYLIEVESYVAGGSKRPLVIAASAVALACLTRYIGFAFIAAGLVTILGFGRGAPRERIRDALLFLGISAVPLMIWVARNYGISGTAFGPRTPSAVTLLENLGATFKFTLGWFAHGRTIARRLVFLGLVAAVAVAAAVRVRREWEKARSALLDLGPLLILVLVYVGTLVMTSSITFSDRIEDRLLSPVYVPVVLLLLAIAGGAMELGSKMGVRRLANGLVVAVAVAWLLSPTAMTAGFIARYSQQGGHGYSAEAWRRSETIRGLLDDRAVKLGCAVYTNVPDAIYILAGLPAIRIPVREEYGTAGAVDDLWRLRGAWPEAPSARLVWFDAVDRKHLLSLNEIGVVADVELVSRYRDGAIYTVTRR